VTIGFGGSVGAESPVVLTGAAIGSNVARFFKMDSKANIRCCFCLTDNFFICCMETIHKRSKEFVSREFFTIDNEFGHFLFVSKL